MTRNKIHQATLSASCPPLGEYFRNRGTAARIHVAILTARLRATARNSLQDYSLATVRGVRALQSWGHVRYDGMTLPEHEAPIHNRRCGISRGEEDTEEG